MVNVKNFGAAGDGVTDDTAAIQAALDTGEVVCFPAGIYNANTIYLRSNGGVHLEEGAVLRAIADKNKCNPDDFPPPNRVFAREHVSGAHFIIGYECENLSFSGKGTIDGNFKAATELQLKYIPLVKSLFCEVNPIPVKAAMAHMGYTENVLRSPLYPMEEANEEKLVRMMRAAGINV